jgi:hypothetical protein
VLFYGTPWTERLTSPDYLRTVLLGGLSSPVEGWLLGFVALWLAAGLINSRGAGVDRPLALLGSALLAVALLAPESVGAAALFGRRWGWVAAVCLVLAVPPPRVRPALRTLFVFALVGALSAATLAAWRDFGRNWTGGFERLLTPIRMDDRVLGLDFVRVVPRLRIDPMFHMAAYAQTERGAEIAYSFAETPSSLVVFDDLPMTREWTKNLHLYPGDLVDDDLRHFDWLLVVARPDMHSALLARFASLVEREKAGPWRLYAVGAGADAARGEAR